MRLERQCKSYIKGTETAFVFKGSARPTRTNLDRIEWGGGNLSDYDSNSLMDLIEYGLESS